MVPASKPPSVSLWAVTKAASNGDEDPYAVVVPYSTWEVATILVVQVTVAPEVEMLVAANAEITGPGLEVVVNEESPETVNIPDPSALLTR